MERLRLLIIAATAILATLLIVISIILAIDMITIIPKQPLLTEVANEAGQVIKAKEIDNYKTLALVLQSQRIAAFEITISKTLLPLLNTLMTIVITYIFTKTVVQICTSYFNTRYKRD